MTDCKGHKIFPGDILVNNDGWEMKILNIDYSCCRVERAGWIFIILRESIKGGKWAKKAK